MVQLSNTPEESYLSKKLEKPNTDTQLHHQRNPEPRIPQPPGAKRQVWKHRPWPLRIRSAGSSDNSRNAPKHLCANQREDNMEPRQCLKQDHSEPDALKSIKHTEPKPERASDQGPRKR